MSSAPTIVVLCSTSGQGRGFVRAILSHPSPARYHVVGVTRNVDGSHAKALLDAHKKRGDRLHLVSADIYDRKSLAKAFEGAYGVFAVTSDTVPGKLVETEDDMKHQLEAGKNIVAAAKETATEHFVFTSLPDVAKASGGKYSKVFHFDFNAQIEEMARRELKSTRNKVYPLGRKYSLAQLASILEKRTSVKTEVRPSTLEEWEDATVAVIGPGFRTDGRQMMEWTEAMPKGKVGWGTIDLAEDRGEEELAVRPSSFEEWLERSAWTGPPVS